MKITILGTGGVGRSFAEKLTSLDHQVMMGTRNVQDTLHKNTTDSYGNPPFSEWHKANESVLIEPFAKAVQFGKIIINALQGAKVLPVFESCNSDDLNGKIIIDISNPLDFSKGFPPSLIDGLNNTNSLGEELQKLLPGSKVVKTLNTMYNGIMINPNMINNGNHTNYICGNDTNAKETVVSILKDFGWKKENILDLGDITNARGTESTLLIWTRIYGATNNGAFNMNIVK